MSEPPEVTRAMLLAWMAGDLELSPAQIEAIPDDLLAEQDAGLDAAFATLSTDLAQPDATDAHVDTAWSNVHDRIAPAIASPASLAPPWRKIALGVGAFVAAGLIFFVARPQPTTPNAAVDPYIKGASAPAVEVEFLRDGADAAAITDGARLTQSDRVIPQARITDPAWLTWVHRGPDGAVQVRDFNAGMSKAGQHVPQQDGQALAYGLRDEPGTHVFVVLASRENLDVSTAARCAFESLSPGVSMRRLTIEVR